jgi:hypothetical protein
VEDFFPRLAKANQEIRFARIQALCRHSFAHAIDQKIVKNVLAYCEPFTRVFHHRKDGKVGGVFVLQEVGGAGGALGMWLKVYGVENIPELRRRAVGWDRLLAVPP